MIGFGNWSDANPVGDEIGATVTDLGAVNTPYPDADLFISAPGTESGTYDSFIEIALEGIGEERLGEDDYEAAKVAMRAMGRELRRVRRPRAAEAREGGDAKAAEEPRPEVRDFSFQCAPHGAPP